MHGKRLCQAELNILEHLKSVSIGSFISGNGFPYSSEAAHTKILAMHSHLDALDVLSKGKLLNVFEACILGPKPTIKQHDVAVEVGKVLLHDRKQLRFWIRGGVHNEDLRWTENRQLMDCADVGLAITNLAEHRFTCVKIHKSQANSGSNASRFTDSADDLLRLDTYGRNRLARSEGSWPPRLLSSTLGT